MNSEDINRLHTHYPDLQVLDADREAEITTNMDKSMESIGEILLSQKTLLDEINDLLTEIDQEPGAADDFITQYDLWVLGKEIPCLNKKSEVIKYPMPTEKTLSSSLVHMTCDRSKIFQLLLSHIQPNERPVKNHTEFLKKQYLLQRNQLVQGNMRLVIHIAKRYSEKGVETDELIQEGSMGLIKAAEKFNRHKGFRFTTYAYWWIQQSIKNAVNQKRSSIRVPASTQERKHKVDKIQQEFLNTHGYKPDIKTLMKKTGLKKEQIQATLNTGNITLSIDTPFYDDGLTLEEILLPGEDKKDYSSDYSSLITDSLIAKRLIRTLPIRQQRIVCLYHGINIADSLSFREIAPQIGVTLERTRQLYHKSMKELQRLMDNQPNQ